MDDRPIQVERSKALHELVEARKQNSDLREKTQNEVRLFWITSLLSMNHRISLMFLNERHPNNWLCFYRESAVQAIMCL